MSPDGNRIFFKFARGSGGQDFRSGGASRREGKCVYDRTTGRVLRYYPEWGHPSWSPDSKKILEKGNILYDLESGTHRHIAPGSPSNHPSFSPDGALFVTDANLAWRQGGRPGEWGIILGSVKTGEFTAIHRFINGSGAKSWRPSHPHPVFNADGRRIYFNENGAGSTCLRIIEIADAGPA